ncbi:MAG: hypothetical protein J2P24_05795 [Streptosporangiales bacterium]|nr:hypothetical protein [Streptosporangiales bacterium]MBO0891030.1 hypothetical protein [Acidothermales bacterium]
MTLENETTMRPDETAATERPSRPWRSNVSQRAVAAAAETRRTPSAPDEPDEPAAGDVDDDEATLAELASLMTAVKTHADARYDAMGDQLAELVTRVDALAAQSEDEDKDEDDEPDPASLRSWTARATRQEWAELIGWVDWMQATYSVAGHSIDPVPPCWPAHLNVAEELAALHASWLAALTDEANAKGVSDAALYWHDRWLWPTRERLSTSFLERCRAGRHELPRPPQPTNPGFVPDTAADEPAPDGQRL